MSYNGWTNYETWAINMFLDGNYTGEGTYRAALELAEEHWSEEDNELDTYELGRALRDFVENEMPTSGLAADLVGNALGHVNWDELAKDWGEGVTEHLKRTNEPEEREWPPTGAARADAAVRRYD